MGIIDWDLNWVVKLTLFLSETAHTEEMTRYFLKILIYFFIGIIPPSKSYNQYSENFLKEGYEILDFYDHNTTVSKWNIGGSHIRVIHLVTS